MTQIIGFANKFYTLWSMRKDEHWFTNSHGQHFLNGVSYQYTYHKNVSTELDKVKVIYPELSIDDKLRGKTNSWGRTEKFEYPTEFFPFGKLVGEPILGSTDVWQLERVYEGADRRRAVLARKQLVVLGELVRHDWKERSSREDDSTLRNGEELIPATDDMHSYIVFYKAVKYATKQQMKQFAIDNQKNIERSQSEYHFDNGSKVELSLKETNSFSFESKFGYITIVTYVDELGRIFKYKGSLPCGDIGTDTFTKIKATIKNTEFDGYKQNMLLRIKKTN